MWISTNAQPRPGSGDETRGMVVSWDGQVLEGPTTRVVSAMWGSGGDVGGGGEEENSGVASGEPQQKMVEGDTVVLPDSRPAPELHPAGPQMPVSPRAHWTQHNTCLNFISRCPP